MGKKYVFSCCGGGQVVSVLPTFESCWWLQFFSVKLLLKKEKINKKRPGLAHIFWRSEYSLFWGKRHGVNIVSTREIEACWSDILSIIIFFISFIPKTNEKNGWLPNSLKWKLENITIIASWAAILGLLFVYFLSSQRILTYRRLQRNLSKLATYHRPSSLFRCPLTKYRHFIY